MQNFSQFLLAVWMYIYREKSSLDSLGDFSIWNKSFDKYLINTFLYPHKIVVLFTSNTSNLQTYVNKLKTNPFIIEYGRTFVFPYRQSLRNNRKFKILQCENQFLAISLLFLGIFNSPIQIQSLAITTQEKKNWKERKAHNNAYNLRRWTTLLLLTPYI